MDALEIATGEVRSFSNAECGFGYRCSRFNTTERGRWIILSTTFALASGGVPQIAYRDLKQYFAQHTGTPTLAEVRTAVRAIRQSKAMLIGDGDNEKEEDSRSAGSFFKNPVLDSDQYAALLERAQQRGLTLPAYPSLSAEGGHQHKVPAAWLVENSGIAKGYTRGGAGISRRHALAIVNRGGATAAEIIALKDEIQRCVGEMWEVWLETEPVMLGF